MATATSTPAATAEPAGDVYHRGPYWPASRLRPLVLTEAEEQRLDVGLAALVQGKAER